MICLLTFFLAFVSESEVLTRLALSPKCQFVCALKLIMQIIQKKDTIKIPYCILKQDRIPMEELLTSEELIKIQDSGQNGRMQFIVQ